MAEVGDHRYRQGEYIKPNAKDETIIDLVIIWQTKQRVISGGYYTGLSMREEIEQNRNLAHQIKMLNELVGKVIISQKDKIRIVKDLMKSFPNRVKGNNKDKNIY